MHLLSPRPKRLVSDGLKRQLDVKYDTAWMLKHKLLQTMKESDDKQPSAASFSSMMSTGVENAVVANGSRRGGAERRLWQQ